ncbi:TniQ family protein [Desulfonatronum parangueonense]
MPAWTIQVPLLPEETLSSWLVRAALSQGCDPIVLTGVVWPKWRVWALDPDRGIPREFLTVLAKKANICATAFEAASIKTVAERITDQALPRTGVWPWILTLGARNRLRSGGQQFCPVCMAQDAKPYYRRQWRFVWHTGCLIHKNQLLDRCPACMSPIEPHRLLAEDRHLALCARCKSDLRDAALLPVSEEMLVFQRLADTVLENNKELARNIPVADWFATAHFLAGLIRLASRRGSSKLANSLRSLGISVGEGMLPATGLPLELLPVAERQAMLMATYRLLDLGLDSMNMVFKEADISVAAFHGLRRQFPISAAEMIDSLPNCNRAPRKNSTKTVTRPRSKRAVMSAWARLQRKMLAEAG